ncbi:MAG: HTTM domain-containing protein [Ferruginibacter sp.]
MNDNSLPGKTFLKKIFQPVDNSPLIIFRIIYGFLLFYHVMAYLLNGTVHRNFIEPPFTFTYIGFEFLQPLPGNGMYLYFGFMALLALLIMLGAWYRLAMTGFALLWTLQYLMQKSGYNNHYYLILLLCWLMAFVPANGYFSIDSQRKPQRKTNTCPQWATWIFIAQVSIVYFFAAISKLNADWISGKFLTIQFSRLSMHELYGSIFGQEWFPRFIAYAGFLFDLLIVPLLLWKKTRKYAFMLSCLFHLFNSFSFRIGIFPYLSIALCTFFFDPEYIRSIFFKNKQPVMGIEYHSTANTINRKLLTGFLGIYLLCQVIIPMRSWFFPGNTFWTEEGYRMSWKMMMRAKSGTIHFKIIDPASGQTWIEDPKTSFSPIHTMWIAISPDITWQYAQWLKTSYAEKGFPNVEVYAIGAVTLNRSKPAPLADTTVDLARVKWYPFKHASWITDHE